MIYEGDFFSMPAHGPLQVTEEVEQRILVEAGRNKKFQAIEDLICDLVEKSERDRSLTHSEVERVKDLIGDNLLSIDDAKRLIDVSNSNYLPYRGEQLDLFEPFVLTEYSYNDAGTGDFFRPNCGCIVPKWAVGHYASTTSVHRMYKLLERQINDIIVHLPGATTMQVAGLIDEWGYETAYDKVVNHEIRLVDGHIVIVALEEEKKTKEYLKAIKEGLV